MTHIAAAKVKLLPALHRYCNQELIKATTQPEVKPGIMC